MAGHGHAVNLAVRLPLVRREEGKLFWLPLVRRLGGGGDEQVRTGRHQAGHALAPAVAGGVVSVFEVVGVGDFGGELGMLKHALREMPLAAVRAVAPTSNCLLLRKFFLFFIFFPFICLKLFQNLSTYYLLIFVITVL